MKITEEVKNKLIYFAKKNEEKSFILQDPSQFLYRYKKLIDIECAAFIASMLSFGNRKQFIPKIQYIFDLSDKTSGSISNWIKSKDFVFSFLPQEDEDNINKKYYRFYSYKDLHDFFFDLHNILEESANIGDYFCKKWQNYQNNQCKNKKHLCHLIGLSFTSSIVPKGYSSACKRTNMLLRWLVRKNSPVDLGLWQWFLPEDLLIPLDTHVLQQSIKLGLLSNNAKANFKSCIELTKTLKQIWPEDPVKCDYALFGLGIDKS